MVKVSYHQEISEYINRISSMVMSMKSILCPCRYEILSIKWFYWCDWYFNNVLRLKSMSNEEIEDSISVTIEKYDKTLNENNSISKVLLFVFNEIHSPMVKEFVSIVEKFRDNVEKHNIIRFGELMNIMCKNSILEMGELKVPCSKICPPDNIVHTECRECWYKDKYGFFCNIHNDIDVVDRKMIIFPNILFTNYTMEKIAFMSNYMSTGTNTTVTLDFSFNSLMDATKMTKIINEACKFFYNVVVSGVDGFDDIQEVKDSLSNLDNLKFM